MAGQRRPSMWRRACKDTATVVRDAPIRSTLATLALGAPLAVLAGYAEDLDVATGWKVALIVVSAGLGGFLALLLVLMIAKLGTARRHQLEDRVDALETTVQEQSAQIVTLTQAELGDADRFVPTYQDLRAALRDAKGKIEGAQQSGELWGRLETFQVTMWRRKKDDLRVHPFARKDDVYGVCVEAFTHVERLTTISSGRWLNRTVKDSDNLGGAVASIDTAIEHLSKCISQAKPAQP